MTGWDRVPSAADWAAAVDLVRQARRVLLLAHVAPDADAVGSALAVGLALRAVGKDVAVSFGDQPFELPANLRFLPGQELLTAPELLDGAFDLAMSFDVSSAERLGVLQQVAESAPALVAVDHHRTFTGFGTLQLVDVTAVATALLSLRLVDELDAELTPEIAACVYAGLLTDTGSFRYSGVRSETHEVAARLLATGIDHVGIARSLYEDRTFAAIRLQSAALGHARLDSGALGGRGVAWTVVTREDRSAAGLPIDALERVIDELRAARDVEVAIVLKQEDSGRWRVSTRSKGSVDVGAVCQAFGGGGHRYAGGFESDAEPETILDGLRAALEAR